MHVKYIYSVVEVKSMLVLKSKKDGLIMTRSLFESLRTIRFLNVMDVTNIKELMNQFDMNYINTCQVSL